MKQITGIETEEQEDFIRSCERFAVKYLADLIDHDISPIKAINIGLMIIEYSAVHQTGKKSEMLNRLRDACDSLLGCVETDNALIDYTDVMELSSKGKPKQ
jgi:hypothetical protein